MKKPMGAAACLSLLMLQLTGFHVHADPSGYIGAPETAYTHTHGHRHDRGLHHRDGAGGAHDSSGAAHDYDGARDVSLLDLALGTFKLPLAMPALVFLCVLFPRASTLTSAEVVYPVLSGRHTRWRPPLRAPPEPAYI